MVKLSLVSLTYAVALAAIAIVGAEGENVSPLIQNFNNLYKKPATPFSSTSNATSFTIEQKLDHFNKSETRTWLMRYMANDAFYVPGGPLFILVGGEECITDNHIIKGLFYDTAKENNAFFLHVEHRYYGQSRPVKNMTIENLKYLDVRQVLADLNHFISFIKSSSSLSLNNSKVILAGSSYAGALVTWFKKLYPDVAAGCWVSSAPLLAKLDFKEYKETTGQSIRLVGGESCYNRIANGINEMQEMIANNRSTELKSALNICQSFDANNQLDVAVLFSFISHAISIAVQHHENNTIQNDCKKIMEGPDDFKSLSNFLVDIFGKTNCTDFTYKHAIAAVQVTTFGSSIERQWYYQLCNGLGWFPTTTSKKQPFGSNVPISFFTYLCKDLFGDEFTQEYMEGQVNKTNQIFGGLNLKVENVYMTHGQLDPWLPLGIKDVDKATIIPMASHGSDTKSISNNDSKQLKAAKLKFKQLVKDWLKA